MIVKMIISIILQIIVLLFLLTKERHNGEKELFKRQKWQPCDVVIIMIIWNIILILSTFMALNFKSIYKLNFAFLVSLFLLLIILGYAKVKYKQKNTDFGFRKSLHANLFFISFVLGSFLFVIFSMLLLYSADSNEFLIIKSCSTGVDDVRTILRDNIPSY